MALPDLIPQNPKAIICGTAVTKTSKHAGAYYASHGNNLYQTLHAVGITDYEIQPQQYSKLADFGIGFTDLVKGRTGLDNELAKSDFDVNMFKQKMQGIRPAFVCFNGKLAASYFLFGKKTTAKVKYGWQDTMIGNTRIFVAPSTGMQGRRYYDIAIWQQFADEVCKL